MKKEQDRLLNMRNEKKISEQDYNLLLDALNKPSFCTQVENSIFMNPFQRIAGLKSLCMGIVLMVIMSVVGSYANMYYDGAFGAIYTINLKTPIPPNFFLLLYQNVVIWIILSLFFLITAKVLRQKNIRAIDFFGTVALSRYPILVLMIFNITADFLDPSFLNQDFSKGIELHLTWIGTINNLIFSLCYIWQIMTYFFALKVASGLEGRRLWGGFIVAIALGDIVSMIFTRLFLYT